MDRPRMRDVAERARVSVATVSLVLNERPGIRISAETRERVRAAAAHLGYVQPRQANRAHAEGLPLGVVGDDLFGAGSTLAGALIDAAAARRVPVLIADWSVAWSSGRGAVQVLRRETVGIVAFSGAGASGAVPPGIPRGSILLDLPATEGYLVGSADDRSAFTSAVQALTDRGHRNIAMVGIQGRTPRQHQRVAGFVDGLRQAGAQARPQWQVIAQSAAEAAQRVSAMFNHAEQTRPTAVVVASHAAGPLVRRVIAGSVRAASDGPTLIGSDACSVCDCGPDGLETYIESPSGPMATWAVDTVLDVGGRAAPLGAPTKRFTGRLVGRDALGRPAPAG